ncbi:hypothetical protein CHS0354_031724 [Potamilus streckersoni]|uniref:Uncharacterized protein n=1 Tax=Potamilus streckersoni TaxID=2493646 RepID=A0AAE0TB68_9BIVA|nr:hypothetical protein CHS0354_031724 [Potamilus streckersoni]
MATKFHAFPERQVCFSTVTMDKKMDPQPKDHKAIDFRRLDSGFQAEDISYRMGASFFKAWLKK